MWRLFRIIFTPLSLVAALVITFCWIRSAWWIEGFIVTTPDQLITIANIPGRVTLVIKSEPSGAPSPSFTFYRSSDLDEADEFAWPRAGFACSKPLIDVSNVALILFLLDPWEFANPDSQAYILTIPDWFPLSVALIAPSAWLAYSADRRRRAHSRIGLCPVCGYDLRMHQSGSRCPECGTVITVRHAAPRGSA